MKVPMTQVNRWMNIKNQAVSPEGRRFKGWKGRDVPSRFIEKE